MKLLKGKIDVTKIEKSKLFKGAKSTYLDIDIWLDDKEDKYGQYGNIHQSLNKEESEAGAAKIFIGNVRKVYDIDTKQESKQDVSPSKDELPF